MVAVVTRDRIRNGCSLRTARRFLQALPALLMFLSMPSHSEVIDDVVVVNRDDPLRTFNISTNDVTGGDCAGNAPGAEVESCPCEFNASGPVLNPISFSGSYSGVYSYQPGTGVTGVDTIDYLGFGDAVVTNCNAGNSASIFVVINENPQLLVPIAAVSEAEDALPTVIGLDTHFSDSDTALGAPFTDVLSYAAVVTATSNSGLLTVTISGSDLTLDYALDQFGTATIEVTVTDNRASLGSVENFVTGNSVTTSFDVTVTPVNDAPVAMDDSATTDEDNPVTVEVLANDSDLDGDTLAVSGTPTATGGAVSVDADGKLTFSPDADFAGLATVDYTISDGASPELTDSARLEITVAAVKDDPFVANPLMDATFAEDGPDQTLDLALVFDDVDMGDTLTYSVTGNSNPELFDAVSIAGTRLTLELAPDGNGDAFITIRATDSEGGSVEDTFQVIVAPINDIPIVAMPIDDVNVDEDGSDFTIDLASVFSDADGETLALSVSAGDTDPLFASVNLSGDALTVSLAPDQNGGVDLTIRATDVTGAFAEDTFRVSVNSVNDSPQLARELDDVVTDEDMDQTVELAGHFDDVDIATDADVLTYSVVSNDNPTLFAATTTTGTALTLALSPNMHGVASLTVRATDSAGASVDDTFQITVNGVNDVPVVSSPIADFSLLEDDSDVFLNLSTVFDDADIPTDNDRLTITLANVSNANLFDEVSVFEFFGWRMLLDLRADQNGFADITVRAVDEQGAIVEDTFRVTVLAVNDLPALVMPFDDVNVDEDAATVTVNLTQHFDDIDIATNNDVLVYNVMNSNSAMFASAAVAGDTLTLDFGADRNGVAIFTIRAADNAGASVEDTFIVTVSPVNDAPFVAQPIADVTLNEDDPNYSIDLVGVFDDVDFDNEGDVFTYALVGNFDGTLFDDVSIDISGGTAALILDLAEHQYGADSLTVRATDKEGISVEDTFRVVVNPVNDVPMAENDLYTIDEDAGPLVMIVLENDFLEDAPVDLVDAGITIVVDGEVFTNATQSVPTTQFDAVGDPVTIPNGTVFIESDFSVSYVPKPNFSGTDFFTYTLRDVDGETSTATVTVRVNALNDAPFGFGTIEYELTENSFLDVLVPGLLLNALDPDGDPMSVVLQQSTSRGQLVINPDGSFTYTPNVGFTGIDSFTYFLSDGTTTSDVASVVALRVTPAPPPPAPLPEGEVEFDFELADLPLELAVGTEPNVLVVMDDSGSMDWTLSAPDEKEGRLLISTRGMSGVGRQASTIYSYVHDLPTNTYNRSSSIGRIVPSEQALDADDAFDGNNYGVWRARTHKYNKLYYNPEIRYLPWRGLAPDNQPFPNVGYKDAPLDPMDPSQNIDLRDEVDFTSYRVPRMDGDRSTKDVKVRDFYIPRYYLTPANGPDLQWNDPHVLVEIRDDKTAYQGGPGRPDCAVKDGNPLTCTFKQEIQNFANWFTYYRSREYVAKSALGRVVAQASTLRVGYAAMNDASDRIPIKEMNASYRAGNKRDVMDQIYAIDSNGSTPLRSRLDEAGRYYECEDGNIFNFPASNPGNPNCPVPASPGGQCQLNYTLVFTDGRWNGSFNDTNRDGPGNGNTVFDGGMYADAIGGTLADVAMHYYERDLHPSLDDEVPTSARDTVGALVGAFGADPDTMHQHMATFGIQFGLSGNMTDADIPGDIRQSVAWGNPFDDAFAKTDDVRHMALNGRGGFLEAFDTEGLQSTMGSVFDEFSSGEGAASAVSFNSQQVSQDNVIFRAFYNTKINSGDLIAQELDLNGLLVNPEVWSAAKELDSKDFDDRVIVTFDTDASSVRFWEGVPFRHNRLSGEQRSTLSEEQVDYLRGDRSNERPLGENYRERSVDRGMLGDIVNSTPVFVGPPSYRLRDRDAFPTDAGNLYSEFRDTHLARPEMVAVGGNDGLLHIFEAGMGEELMAYVPDKLINGEPYANPLSQLTSSAYNHKYFVDLTPSVQDVFAKARSDFTREWRTVLVGGLRGGGKGYFAIDITDPSRFNTENRAADQVLWEFTDADDVSPDPAKFDLQGMSVKDLGYSFSQPTLVMTNAEVGANPVRKRWGAIFGNGYNATAGVAKLFALFIEDGVDGWDYGAGDFVKVDTGFGAPGPGQANEGRPNALGTPRLIDADGNGTADLAYAGDLRGNLYRFDLSDVDPQNWSATQIFTATYRDGADDVPQPITNQPIVIRNPQEDEGYVVIFGTGSFVTVPDATSTDIQSLYGIWDRLEVAPDIRRDDLVEQEITNLADPEFGNVRTLSSNPVSYSPPSTHRGWFVDFDAERPLTDVNGDPNPDQSGNATGPQFPGERAVRSLQLRGGFLFINTVIPRDNTTCLQSPGGFQMALNPSTGGLGGLREQIAFDLNGDNQFDDLDSAAGGEVIAGMRFEDAVPSDAAFVGSRRYTQLSDREVDVQNTNTNVGSRTGRLSWLEI